MKGKLWVLQGRAHESTRIMGQVVEFEELPEKWKRFSLRTEQGAPRGTGRVEEEPREEKPRELYFWTRQTTYTLELYEG